MYYVIKSKASDEPVEKIQPNELNDRISAIAGRNPLSFPSVARRLAERGRIYVATAKGSTGRETLGQGFILEQVNP